jgi:hypothetical protein
MIDKGDDAADYYYERARDDEYQRRREQRALEQARQLEEELGEKLKEAQARGDYFEVARLVTQTQAHKDLVEWQKRRGV